MLRKLILAASRSPRLERVIVDSPVSGDVVRRYVPGPAIDDAVRATRDLTGSGLTVTVDNLGEDTTTLEQATAVRDEYVALLRALSAAELTPAAEVSVKLSAVGQRLDEKQTLENARAICAAATEAGTTVTLDMEDHTTTDSTLEILGELRKDFPTTGAVVQAYLRRTEADCRELSAAGSRVRLCKGAYAEPESVAYQSRLEVDKSFVRCVNILMAGDGYPMLATHDPRLIAIGQDRARWFGRSADQFELQMLYGVRPAEQRRLAHDGYTMRVYLPYGTESFGYLVRRLAERPANMALFARSLVARG
ncbi:proline dehydrogenase family protein [Pilimelia columellifera]|uniref:proline dehydrogenase n=1 Tax=Pilimelia columellifera subsp. columellifera TaxID=706583 RepID=A0ABN3NFL5_9ACTN